MAKLNIRIENGNIHTYTFTNDVKDKVIELLTAVCPLELMSAERNYSGESTSITIEVKDEILNNVLTKVFEDFGNRIFIKPETINYN